VDSGDSLQQIQITTLDTVGALKLSGVDVLLNDVIAVGDIGNLTFTPVGDANGAGYDSFGFKVHDGTEYSAAAYTQTIDVNAVNDAPTVATINKSGNEDTVISFAAANFTAAFSDVDGDSLSQIQVTSLPANGSLKLSGVVVNVNDVIAAGQLGNLTFTPTADWNGSSSFDYLGHDGTTYSAASALVDITINANNDAPTAANNTTATNEDTTFTFTAANFNFSDVDIGDNLQQIQVTSLETASALKLAGVDVTLNQVISRAAIDAGDLTFDPVADANGNGYDSFGFKVNDGTAYSTAAYTQTIDVNSVNDAPTAANNTVATNEDTDYTFVTGDFSFSDIDGDSLNKVQITSLPGNGTLKLSGATVNLNDEISVGEINAGNLDFVPAADANGVNYDTFQFKVHDGTAYSALAYTQTVDVTAVNDAPMAATDSTATDENVPVTTGDVLTNDTDAENDSLTITGFTQGAHGTVIDNGDGTFDYTPDNAFNGADSFTYTITDGNGKFDTATVNVTVNAVNDAPVAADNTVATHEDTDYTFVAGDFNFSDTDGDALSKVQITSLPGYGTLELSGVAVALNDDITAADIDAGNLTFTPAPDASGTGYDSFTFKVNDGSVYSDSAYTQTIDVNAVNDDPTAVNDAAVTTEDVPVTTGNVLINDTDTENDTLTVTGFSQGVSGSVVNNGDGTFTYIPNPDSNGLDSFTYTVSDGHGGTSTATITVTVHAVNDLPVATDDTIVTSEDTPVSSANVLTNDIDLDGDALEIDSFTQPGHGSVVHNGDGTFTFVPEANFHGSDSFTYTVSDTHGGTDTATVHISVNSVNDAPEAINDTATTDEDTSVTTENVLANDTDPDDDTLAVASFSQPEHGSVTYNGDGTFSYLPEANYNGDDSFNYILSDGSGGSDSATVNITVDAVEDVSPPPVIDDQIDGDDEPPGVIFPDSDPTVILDDILGAPTPPVNDTPDDTGENDDYETPNSPPPEEDSPTSTDLLDEPMLFPAVPPDAPDNAETPVIDLGEIISERPNPFGTPSPHASLKVDKLDISIEGVPDSFAALAGVETSEGAIDYLLNEQTVVVNPEVLAEIAMFHKELDFLTEEIEDSYASETLDETVAIGAIAGLTVSTSVGYALWALKGGSFIASLASSIPLLGAIDPLPILERENKDKKRDEGRKDDQETDDVDEQKLESLIG
jgi:VCBS repeat-containing protein